MEISSAFERTKTNIKWELTELKFKLTEGSAPIFSKITNVKKLLDRKFHAWLNSLEKKVHRMEIEGSPLNLKRIRIFQIFQINFGKSRSFPHDR
ncbi:hypothetical protein FXW07_12485 [Methanosarcina sp. DH1]|uniref:hypothetical protein n=1 Tax=Methanosarcina sp. DH1 TaxID=2605695 RepID=UPI001E4B8107|nr:hypothetical protein [Methanosarcina sp. DH1]MCC4767412.1 hypothetical protein [Methanosarcina sp. DH1]